MAVWVRNTAVVSNAGTVIGGNGGASGESHNGGNAAVGVSFAGVGTLSNTATIRGGHGGLGGYGFSGPSSEVNGGAGGAAADGVVLTGAGRVSNAGTIAGGSGGYGGNGVTYTGISGTLYGNGGNGGAAGVAILLEAGGTVTNSGKIIGGTGGAGGGGTHGGHDRGGYNGSSAAGGVGVQLQGFGTVSNTGTIAGGSGQASESNDGIGVLLNAGGIVQNGAAGVATALIEGYDGVRVAGAAGTVINYGTIAGTYADYTGAPLASVLFTSASGVLVVEAGSQLTGGAAVGDGGTPEFGAGGGAGTISGLSGAATGSTGGTFTGFSIYQIAAGSNWTLTGASAISASDTLAVYGMLAVDGSLEVDGAFVGTGTIAGSGTLNFGGDITLNGSPLISVGYLGVLGSSAVTLDESLRFAGSLDEAAGGTLAVAAGDGLTLSGTGTLAGTVSGAGELLFEGGTEAIDSGADLTVATRLAFGTASVNVNANISVASAFEDGNFSTIEIAAGDTLTLAGAESEIVGTVAGTGALAVSGTVILPGADLGVSQFSISGASTGVTLQSDLDYAGELALSSGTLDLGAYALTLTGAGPTFAGTTRPTVGQRCATVARVAREGAAAGCSVG